MFGKEKKPKRFISKESQSLGLGAAEVVVDTVTGVNSLLMHAPDGITPLLDENGKVDVLKLNAIMFENLRNGYYTVGEKAGQAFEIGKKWL